MNQVLSDLAFNQIELDAESVPVHKSGYDAFRGLLTRESSVIEERGNISMSRDSPRLLLHISNVSKANLANGDLLNFSGNNYKINRILPQEENYIAELQLIVVKKNDQL